MPKSRNKSNQYQIRIRGVRRRHPDLGKITRAVIDIALMEAAREAAAEAEAQATRDKTARALGRTAINHTDTGRSAA